MTTRRVLLLAGILLAPGTAQEQTAQPTQFWHTFGAHDEPGAMAVWFDRQSASVREVQLLDHHATPTREDPYALALGVGRPAQRQLVCYDAGSQPVLEQLADLDRLWEAQVSPDAVRFALDCGHGLTVEKTYRKPPGRRDLQLTITLRAAGDHPRAGDDLRLILRGCSLANPIDDHVLGNPAIGIGVAKNARGSDVVNVVVADGKPEPPDLPDLFFRATSDLALDFAGTTNRHFAAFLFPLDDAGREAVYQVDVGKQPPGAPLPGYLPFSVPVANYWLQLRVPRRNETAQVAYGIYLGPKTPEVFDSLPDYARFDAVLEHDLNPACFCNIPGAKPMARFLLWLLRRLHDLVGSWGIAIVLLTILVRGALVPLNFRMQKTMRAFGLKMQRLKPQLDEIQKKYANDPKKKQEAMVAFQREHKLIPPLGGCLPLFVTIPVFLGLFTALRVAYELRHEPFLLWIHDLSQPDRLFPIGWSFVPWFNLLPIVMVGMWWWLQKSMPLPSDPQQRQVMQMMRFMPLVMGVFLYNYASGLMVYMITSSVFGIVEQKITKKVLGPMPTEAPAMAMPQF
jgi:YidC/Oxa1 family membrane protein insertase